MNAEDFNITTWRNLLLSYKHAEAEIDKFMPASRRGGSNTYCGSLIQFPDERIRSARNIRELQGLFPSRYMKVNLQAYSRHRTVEFRQHSGTISFTKIENWGGLDRIYLCIRGFSACRNQTGRFSFPGRETKVVL